MILEGGKPGNNLPSQPECRNLIRESLFRLWDHIKDCLAKLLKRRALGLVECIQVGRDFIAGHDVIINRSLFAAMHLDHRVSNAKTDANEIAARSSVVLTRHRRPDVTGMGSPANGVGSFERLTHSTPSLS